MHIIIGLLTLVATAFLVYRRFNEAGFSVSSFNPFLWKRRRDWHQRKSTNPLFILEENKDVAAALFFIIAKLDGELTRETKDELLNDFQSLLNMTVKEAQGTLQQTGFMLEQYPIIQSDLAHILNPRCVERLNVEQREKILTHLPVVATREGEISHEQQQWIEAITKQLSLANQQTF